MDEANAPCDTPQHRQFDFWLGEWEVRTQDGELAGHNSIRRVLEGCALREEWQGARGLLGTSLSAYSSSRKAWHQTWVDSSGTVLLLDGGLVDGAMVLEGEAALPDEPTKSVLHRISWMTVDGDENHVRQHWQVSEDGEGWETAFDGRYRRVVG